MTRPAGQSVPSPRWVAPWLALLPAAYVVSPLALLALPQLRRLPRAVLWLLGGYALSQQLPAFFSPEPLLASALALGRTLLMLSLIGVGAALGEGRQLRPIAFGLSIVYLTALTYSLLSNVDFLTGRLSHPYMTAITLGLAGAYGLWVTAFAAGSWVWRIPLGTAAVGILLLSGSRGPLLAAGFGLLAGLLVRQSGRWRGGLLLLGFAVAVSAAAVLGMRESLAPLTRLVQVDIAGRQIIWHNVLSVIRSEPLGGVGSYRLGSYLATPGQCQTFVSAGQLSTCPEWLTALVQPWLIAHNVTLQQLAESGPLGTLGFFALLGAVLGITLKRREPLVVACISGLLLTNITDNTLLTPGPFVGELFWILAGTQLQHLRPEQLGWQTGVLGAALLGILSLPVIALTVGPSTSPAPAPQFRLFYAPVEVNTPQNYPLLADLALPPGRYLASLNSCVDSCRPLMSAPFTVQEGHGVIDWRSLTLSSVRQQRLELRVYPNQPLALRPLGVHTWDVTMQSPVASPAP